MKIIIILLFSVVSVFSQNQNLAAQKISAYIKNCNGIDDIIKVEIFKKKFPLLFNSFPDLYPINPKNNPKLGSLYSMKRLHPVEGIVKPHLGVDIIAEKNTPVYATGDGIAIRNVFYNGKAGNSVEIKHDYGFTSKYFHLSIFIVKNGEKVKKGQIIGFLGTSGSSTGPHLHYELIKNVKNINPYHFLKTIPEHKLKNFPPILPPFGSKIPDFGGIYLHLK